MPITPVDATKNGASGTFSAAEAALGGFCAAHAPQRRYAMRLCPVDNNNRLRVLRFLYDFLVPLTGAALAITCRKATLPHMVDADQSKSFYACRNLSQNLSPTMVQAHYCIDL